MISEWDIQQDFRAKVLTVSGIPGEDNRAWENKIFTPTIDTPWMRETLLPADERLSANDEVEQVGLCQYDYFVPIGHSIKAAKTVATAIKHAFKPTTVLDGLVRIDKAQVLSGSKKDPWYMIPVQISYTVYGQNQ